MSLSDEHRAAISRGMKGKRNAVGPHRMSEAGRKAIAEAQRKRRLREKEEKGDGKQT